MLLATFNRHCNKEAQHQQLHTHRQTHSQTSANTHTQNKTCINVSTCTNLQPGNFFSPDMNTQTFFYQPEVLAIVLKS